MLTQIEMKILDWVFYHCSRSVTIPMKWNRNLKRMSLSVKPLNAIMGMSWLVLLPSLIFEALQIPSLAHSRNINGIILHGMVVLPHTTNVLFKLSIWLYKEHMVQLINEILEINSSWGTDI